VIFNAFHRLTRALTEAASSWLKIRAAKNREYRLAKAHPNENFNHPPPFSGDISVGYLGGFIVDDIIFIDEFLTVHGKECS
jgi:hypothetical protein